MLSAAMDKQAPVMPLGPQTLGPLTIRGPSDWLVSRRVGKVSPTLRTWGQTCASSEYQQKESP